MYIYYNEAKVLGLVTYHPLYMGSPCTSIHNLMNVIDLLKLFLLSLSLNSLIICAFETL